MSEHGQHWRNPESGQVECECCCGWALDYERLKKDHQALVGRLREALSWALDLLDMYDENLIEMGSTPEKVYSPTHLRAKIKARALLAEMQPGSGHEGGKG
jgi:hypothetical protein